MARVPSDVSSRVTRIDSRIPARAAVGRSSTHAVDPRMRDRVLGEDLFKDALVRERKRADRSDQPFAVLLVERGGDFPEQAGWPSILSAQAAAIRKSDIVGWLEQSAVLGVLLHQAPESGAVGAMHRLRREIAKLLGDAALSALSLRLHPHGGARAGGAAGPSVDLLLEASVPRRRHAWRHAVKRTLDVFGSGMLLVLFAPLWLAAFVAVKLTSPGPALFRQVRIGRRGQPFTMLKFRTMYANAGHRIHQEYVTWFIKSSGQQTRKGDEIFKLTDDPRVTPVGRFLRRTSLDELPQLWNVMRGDMSLVGPRPPLPFEVEQYQPWHRLRVLEAVPGLTGPWQVNGRSHTTFDEMVRLDVRYARTHSLWTDIRILAATPRAMVSGKGAC